MPYYITVEFLVNLSQDYHVTECCSRIMPEYSLYHKCKCIHIKCKTYEISLGRPMGYDMHFLPNQVDPKRAFRSYGFSGIKYETFDLYLDWAHEKG